MDFGHWDQSIHEIPAQLTRIDRVRTENMTVTSIDRQNKCGTVCGGSGSVYHVTLDACSCPDFVERGLPCKHIYKLADALTLDKKDTRVTKNKGKKFKIGLILAAIGIVGLLGSFTKTTDVGSLIGGSIMFIIAGCVLLFLDKKYPDKPANEKPQAKEAIVPPAPVSIPVTPPADASENNPFTFELSGKTVYVYKNDRDYFDGEIVARSASGEYMIIDGVKGEDTAFAVLSLRKLVVLKKCDDGVEYSIVADDGRAVIVTDNESFLTISADGKVSTKSIGFCAEPSCFFIAFDYCAFSCDNGSEVSLVCFDLNAEKTWKKSIEQEYADGKEAKIERCGHALALTLATGEVLRYALDGGAVLS